MPIDALEEPLLQDVLRRETYFMGQARNVGHHGRGLTFAVRNRAEPKFSAPLIRVASRHSRMLRAFVDTRSLSD